eukprot:CCRYP_007163-RA/>CCRYP_007163-RA protein AED:0.10 eAED:-0.00 QI:0/0/0/1/1/1/2/0/240
MSTPPQAVTPPSKKRKTSSTPELLDVASSLNLPTGTRLQVKWTISDEDDSNAVAAANNEQSTTTSNDNNKISVWWTATLRNRTSETHTLTPEELDEIDLHNNDDDDKDVVVAFVSDAMLLNLSTEEIMIYRREGEPSPPSSPVREEEDEEEGVRHLTAAGISELMDEIMESSLRKTGVSSKLAGMPMAMQQQFAEKVKVAKERLYEKLMGEMERVGEGGGERVISGDVVRRCLSEMGEAL